VAEKWGTYLMKNNLFEHSNSSFGENLYQTRSSTLDKAKLVKKAVKAWYNEIQVYDFEKSEFTASAGHFTALVWKETKRMGVAVISKPPKNSRSKTRSIVVCAYDPPGNQVDGFAANVLPPNDLLKQMK